MIRTTIIPVIAASTIGALPALADPNGMVISQIYGGGGSVALAPYRHDFVELYNGGETPVSLAGWSIQYAPREGAPWIVTALTGTIHPRRYYLVQEGSSGVGGAALPTPDDSGTTNLSATMGCVALCHDSSAIRAGCPSSNVVDLVGYGSGPPCSEGSRGAEGATTRYSIARWHCFDQYFWCHNRDTNDNHADFANINPCPRNSATIGHPGGPVLMPKPSLDPVKRLYR